MCEVSPLSDIPRPMSRTSHRLLVPQSQRLGHPHIAPVLASMGDVHSYSQRPQKLHAAYAVRRSDDLSSREGSGMVTMRFSPCELGHPSGYTS